MVRSNPPDETGAICNALARAKSPGAGTRTEPPDKAQGGGVLLLVEQVGPVSEEEWPVGEVAAPLGAYEKTAGEQVVGGDSGLLERLAEAAEQAGAIIQVFGAKARSEFSKLIVRIRSAAGHASRRTVGGETPDDVVGFGGERQVWSEIPRRVG